jgi:hypothetical protein
MHDEVQRRPRGWWLLGLAFCFLVFLEVFVAISSLPGMIRKLPQPVPVHDVAGVDQVTSNRLIRRLSKVTQM